MCRGPCNACLLDVNTNEFFSNRGDMFVQPTTVNPLSIKEMFIDKPKMNYPPATTGVDDHVSAVPRAHRREWLKPRKVFAA